MAAGDIYGVLDIGSYALKLVTAVEKVNGSLLIENATSKLSRHIVEGQVVNIDRVQTELESLIKGMNLYSVNVHLCHSSLLGVNTMRSAQIRGRISWEDIKNNIQNSEDWLSKTDKYKEYYTNEFKLDNSIITKNPIGESASSTRIDYHLVSVDQNVINDIDTTIKNADLNIIDYCIGLKASAEFLLSEKQKYNGVILIDIGHELVKIIAYHKGNILLSLAFSISGASIEDEIIKHYNCSKAEAIKLKEDYGFIDNNAKEEDSIISYTSLEGEKFLSIHDLSLVITLVYERIFSLVLKKLQVYKIPYKTFKSGVILVGGHAQLPYLRPYAIGVLQTHVSIGTVDTEFLERRNIFLNPKKNLNKLIHTHEYLHALSALVYTNQNNTIEHNISNTGNKRLGKLKKGWNNLFKSS